MTRDIVRLLSLGILATSLLVPFGTPCRADDQSAEPSMKSPEQGKPAETPQPSACAERCQRAPGHTGRQAQARAYARAGGLQGPGPRRPGSTPSGRVQYARQLRHRGFECLPRVRLRDRDRTIDGRRKPAHQRHLLPVLELSLQRLPIAHRPARPRRRADRLRLPGASRRVPGHAGHVAGPGRLRPARGAERAQGFGPRRDGKTRLPARRRSVAGARRPGPLRRPVELEERSGRDLVDRADRRGRALSRLSARRKAE